MKRKVKIRVIAEIEETRSGIFDLVIESDSEIDTFVNDFKSDLDCLDESDFHIDVFHEIISDEVMEEIDEEKIRKKEMTNHPDQLILAM